MTDFTEQGAKPNEWTDAEDAVMNWPAAAGSDLEGNQAARMEVTGPVQALSRMVA
mgnify:CR=1 FL=1